MCGHYLLFNMCNDQWPGYNITMQCLQMILIQYSYSDTILLLMLMSIIPAMQWSNNTMSLMCNTMCIIND